MKSSWPLIFLPIECSLFSLCFKIKTTPRSCTKHLDKDTTKARNTAPFVCGKAWLYFRRQSGESCSKHALRVENRLSMADYFYVFMMLYPLSVAACPATARDGVRKCTCFRCRCTLTRVYCTLLLYSF